jgi:hypothetical protein
MDLVGAENLAGVVGTSAGLMISIVNSFRLCTAADCVRKTIGAASEMKKQSEATLSCSP